MKGPKTLILTALSLLLPCQASSANVAAALSPGQTAPATPSGLYHHVWELINDHYFDPTYHDQKWARWEHRYDGKLKNLDDARKGIETMLASLADRYTRYLDPSAFDDEKAQIKAELTGVGIQLGVNKTQQLVVIAPIEESPAERAGIMSNDVILAIDGKPTTGLSVEQASKRIRGEIGTRVNLSVLRDTQRLEFSIERGEIPIKSVYAVKMLNDDIGYLQLSTFMSEHAGNEVRKALEKLSPARGLIIDLRNNPGGLVTNAIDICSMFLDRDANNSPVIVSTIDRSGKPNSVRVNHNPISHQPIVMLINGGSASAAEITSGALHDSKRAQLVGQKSFGKGLVQSITKLEDGGGVNVTIARYVTPNMTDIHKKGIVPDVNVELSNDDYKDGKGPWFLYRSSALGPPPMNEVKDIQLNRAIEVLEDSMQHKVQGIVGQTVVPAQTDMGSLPTVPQSESGSPFLKLQPFPNLPVPGVGIQQQ